MFPESLHHWIGLALFHEHRNNGKLSLCVFVDQVVHHIEALAFYLLFAGMVEMER